MKDCFDLAHFSQMKNCKQTADFLPLFSVRAIKGQEDVTIRVSDQGGGIPRRMTDTIFEYLYTTAPTPQLTSSCDVPNNPGMGMPAPIAGE